MNTNIPPIEPSEGNFMRSAPVPDSTLYRLTIHYDCKSCHAFWSKFDTLPQPFRGPIAWVQSFAL